MFNVLILLCLVGSVAGVCQSNMNEIESVAKVSVNHRRDYLSKILNYSNLHLFFDIINIMFTNSIMELIIHNNNTLIVLYYFVN